MASVRERANKTEQSLKKQRLLWITTGILGILTVVAGWQALFPSQTCPTKPDVKASSDNGSLRMEMSPTECEYVTDGNAVQAQLASELSIVGGVLDNPNFLVGAEGASITDDWVPLIFSTPAQEVLMGVKIESLTTAIEDNSSLAEGQKESDVAWWQWVIAAGLGFATAKAGSAAVVAGGVVRYSKRKNTEKENGSGKVELFELPISALTPVATHALSHELEIKDANSNTLGRLMYLATKRHEAKEVIPPEELEIIQASYSEYEDWKIRLDELIAKPGGGGYLALHGDEAQQAYDISLACERDGVQPRDTVGEILSWLIKKRMDEAKSDDALGGVLRYWSRKVTRLQNERIDQFNFLSQIRYIMMGGFAGTRAPKNDGGRRPVRDNVVDGEIKE